MAILPCIFQSALENFYEIGAFLLGSQLGDDLRPPDGNGKVGGELGGRVAAGNRAGSDGSTSHMRKRGKDAHKPVVVVERHELPARYSEKTRKTLVGTWVSDSVILLV